MKRIIYCNINYTCNNRCVFCFSHNVGEKSYEMNMDRIKSILDLSAVTPNDIFVINGGEPSVHSKFTELLLLLGKCTCSCNIYSNGRKLNNIRQDVAGNITFIIPIHGSGKVHDLLTGIDGAYNETINSLHYLTNQGIRYRLKFILTKEMIAENFNILEFLTVNDFRPEEIYLSRLNATIKSKNNEYVLPEEKEEIKFLNRQLEILNAKGYRIKILDYPPCYINKQFFDINLTNIEPAQFFYNDFKYFMKERTYPKEHLEKLCDGCKYESVCDFLSESYYLLQYNKDGKITLELE